MSLEERFRAERGRLDQEYRDFDDVAFLRRLARRIEDGTDEDWLRGFDFPEEIPERVVLQAPPGSPGARRPKRRAGRRGRRGPRNAWIVQRGTAPRDELARLCGDILRRDLSTVADFCEDYDATGARTFACLQYLSGRVDAAVYWWGFATGAEDALAAHCLALHATCQGQHTLTRLWNTYARWMGFSRGDLPGRDEVAPAHPAVPVGVPGNQELADRGYENGLPKGLLVR